MPPPGVAEIGPNSCHSPLISDHLRSKSSQVRPKSCGIRFSSIEIRPELDRVKLVQPKSGADLIGTGRIWLNSGHISSDLGRNLSGNFGRVCMIAAQLGPGSMTCGRFRPRIERRSVLQMSCRAGSQVCAQLGGNFGGTSEPIVRLAALPRAFRRKWPVGSPERGPVGSAWSDIGAQDPHEAWCSRIAPGPVRPRQDRPRPPMRLSSSPQSEPEAQQSSLAGHPANIPTAPVPDFRPVVTHLCKAPSREEVPKHSPNNSDQLPWIGRSS